MTREELLKYREWLIKDVLDKASDISNHKDMDHYNRILRQIDDIDWQLETDPPRESPKCGADLPFRLHKVPCVGFIACYTKPERRRMLDVYIRGLDRKKLLSMVHDK